MTNRNSTLPFRAAGVSRVTTAALGAVLVFALAACSGSGESQSDARDTEQTKDSMAMSDTSLSDVEKETADLLETLKDYGADRRDEAVQRVDAAVAELDQQIEAFQNRANNAASEMNEAAQEQMRENLELLRDKRTALAKSVERLQQDTEAAWNDVKNGFGRAYVEVSDALADAREEFQSSSG